MAASSRLRTVYGKAKAYKADTSALATGTSLPFTVGTATASGNAVNLGQMAGFYGLSVTDARYGADNTGAVDAMAAFQAAHDAMPSGGGVVLVPHGTYKFVNTTTAKTVHVTKPVTFVFEDGAKINYTVWGVPLFCFNGIDGGGLRASGHGRFKIRSQATFVPAQALPTGTSDVASRFGWTGTVTQDREYTCVVLSLGSENLIISGMDHAAETPGSYKAAGVIVNFTQRYDGLRARNNQIVNCTLNDYNFGVICSCQDGLVLSNIRSERYDQYNESWSVAGHLLYQLDFASNEIGATDYPNRNTTVRDITDVGTYSGSAHSDGTDGIESSSMLNFTAIKITGAKKWNATNIKSGRPHGALEVRNSCDGATSQIDWHLNTDDNTHTWTGALKYPVLQPGAIIYYSTDDNKVLTNNDLIGIRCGDVPRDLQSLAHGNQHTSTRMYKNRIQATIEKDVSSIVSQSPFTFAGQYDTIDLTFELSGAFSGGEHLLLTPDASSTAFRNIITIKALGQAVSRVPVEFSGTSDNSYEFINSEALGPRDSRGRASTAGQRMVTYAKAPGDSFSVAIASSASPSTTLDLAKTGAGPYFVSIKFAYTANSRKRNYLIDYSSAAQPVDQLGSDGVGGSGVTAIACTCSSVGLVTFTGTLSGAQATTATISYRKMGDF